MRYLPDGVWMQKADKHTIEKIGISSMVLMERAALKTVEVMETEQMCIRDRVLTDEELIERINTICEELHITL